MVAGGNFYKPVCEDEYAKTLLKDYWGRFDWLTGYGGLASGLASGLESIFGREDDGDSQSKSNYLDKYGDGLYGQYVIFSVLIVLNISAFVVFVCSIPGMKCQNGFAVGILICGAAEYCK